jgi:acyl-CoA reductase-like NAD-dependent aldehyde dehydrogenase
MSRLPVIKTLKLYVNGQFVRSESGRTIAVRSARGETMQVSRTSRKDLRDAVNAARAAQPGWAKRSAYNRGQILYRLGEMLEDRVSTFDIPVTDVHTATDRAIHHAGWTDKITALLSSVNPVASAHVNYSMIGATGVFVAVPHPADGLLGLVEATCAPLLMGNTVLLLVTPENAELATRYAEALATSDMPGGAVAVLTGELKEMITEVSRHDDLDGLLLFGDAADAELKKGAEIEGARVLRRIVQVGRADRALGPIDLSRLAEVKTVWMSSQLSSGGGGAY